MEVTEVDSASVAAKTLEQSPPRTFDAIVLDLQMPRPDDLSDAEFNEAAGLPGIWILRRSTAKIATEKIAIIILTNKKPEEYTAALERPDMVGIRSFISVHRKIDTSSRQLPSIVRQAVSRVRVL